MRLIDGDELLTAFPVDDEPMLTKSCVRMTIRRMPTVDAVPVKRGYWIRHDWAEEAEGCLIPNYECSVCHACKRDESDYCPDCGAKMDCKGGDGND